MLPVLSRLYPSIDMLFEDTIVETKSRVGSIVILRVDDLIKFLFKGRVSIKSNPQLLARE